MASFVSRRELSPSSTHSTVVAQTVVLKDRPWAQLGSSVDMSVTPALARRLEFASLCPEAQTASLHFPFRDSFLILRIMTPQSSLTGTPFKQHPSSVTWSVMANPVHACRCLSHHCPSFPACSSGALGSLPFQSEQGSNLSKMGSGEPRPAHGGSVAAERLDLPWCPQLSVLRPRAHGYSLFCSWGEIAASQHMSARDELSCGVPCPLVAACTRAQSCRAPLVCCPRSLARSLPISS